MIYQKMSFSLLNYNLNLYARCKMRLYNFKSKSNLNIYFLLNQSSKISKYDPQIYPQKIYHSYISI